MVDFFFDVYKDATWWFILLEFVVFVFGILSVWYAGKENILVYPTGIVATVITVYLLYVTGYLGDMVLNGYYSLMSVFGWYNWSRVDGSRNTLKISRTTTKEKWYGFAFFIITLGVIYGVYRLFGNEIGPENYIDILTSGIFFTAMYYMALKKIENWTLWVIANVISIPLYAYRGLGMLSLQFIVFTVLAIQAYLSWKKMLEDENK